MNPQFIEARELILRARESLRRGDKPSAHQLGERAALLAPDMEDAWLVLAASDPDRQEALAYAQKALQLNPHSTRAHRAVEWAADRLKQERVSVDSATGLPGRHAYQTAVAMPVLQKQGRNWLLPALLAGSAVLCVGFLALLVVARPALASVVNSIRFSTQEELWAQADVPKPGVTPIDPAAFEVQAEGTGLPALVPTRTPEGATPTKTPRHEGTSTAAPTEEATAVPAATETPGVVAMEVLADTPTRVPPTPGITVGNEVRWIDVDLTNQMVYAYEGDSVVNSFVVSTGTWLTPTITGKHKIYIKVRVQDMRGPGYHLRDVPYVMFFSGDYGLHGTYWHNNFGTPMSRGCVNLTIDDAAWLFNWASVGTVVNVHY